jgi:hypothetical protein
MARLPGDVWPDVEATVWRPTRTSGCALSANVLEDVAAAVSKRLVLVDFGQTEQLRDHWSYG